MNTPTKHLTAKELKKMHQWCKDHSLNALTPILCEDGHYRCMVYVDGLLIYGEPVTKEGEPL